MIDHVKITVRAGKGGDGIVAFRREKYVPKGGPNGGDGGKGGDLYFMATNNLNTLEGFRYKKVFEAEKGERGGGSNLTGHGGDDLTLKVPVGTLVYEIGEEKGNLIADFISEGETILIVKGGEGGRGNTRFKSATNRTPRHAEPGKPGEGKELELELKLLADVGLIGLPNAGKSTLISQLTAAKPKIADYPFTTLEPNLGVMYHKGKATVLADIPGLIEGASKGKGLGVEFLKHIERTKILLHLIDVSTQGDKLKDFETIKKELADFGQKLDKKPEIIVLSKIDLVDPNKIKELENDFSKKKLIVLKISSFSGEGLDTLKDKIIEKVNRK